jgi:hypothetical protein
LYRIKEVIIYSTLRALSTFTYYFNTRHSIEYYLPNTDVCPHNSWCNMTHSPHAAPTIHYGAKTQFAPTPDDAPYLDAGDQKRGQEVLGTLLYYARAVDYTMLPAIGTIATQQANGTAATMRAITQLLNYCATHPDACIRYVASDMVLWIDSDASYLSAPKARSRAAGYDFLSSMPTDPSRAPLPTDPGPPANGAIDILCTIMRKVLSSAAEAESGGLFLKAAHAFTNRQ